MNCISELAFLEHRLSKQLSYSFAGVASGLGGQSMSVAPVGASARGRSGPPPPSLASLSNEVYFTSSHGVGSRRCPSCREVSAASRAPCDPSGCDAECLTVSNLLGRDQSVGLTEVRRQRSTG